jgi:hypothetical protein
MLPPAAPSMGLLSCASCSFVAWEVVGGRCSRASEWRGRGLHRGSPPHLHWPKARMRPCCTLLEENMASTVRGPNQLLDQLHAQCLGAALSVLTFEMRAVDLPATICSAVEWRQLGGAVAGAGRLSEGSYRGAAQGFASDLRRARTKRILQSPVLYNKMAARAVSRPAPSRTVALSGEAVWVFEVRTLNLPLNMPVQMHVNLD